MSATETITRWADCINRVDIDGVKKLATPDATWWTVGPPGKLAGITGDHTYEHVMNNFQLFAQSVEWFRLEIRDIIVSAAGDSAVAEVDTTAKSTEKGEYANVALIKFKFDKEGKIVQGREYLDLITLAHFFGIPLT